MKREAVEGMGRKMLRGCEEKLTGCRGTLSRGCRGKLWTKRKVVKGM